LTIFNLKILQKDSILTTHSLLYITAPDKHVAGIATKMKNEKDTKLKSTVSA
jgi:hypothetical protein